VAASEKLQNTAKYASFSFLATNKPTGAKI